MAVHFPGFDTPNRSYGAPKPRPSSSRQCKSLAVSSQSWLRDALMHAFKTQLIMRVMTGAGVSPNNSTTTSGASRARKTLSRACIACVLCEDAALSNGTSFLCCRFPLTSRRADYESRCNCSATGGHHGTLAAMTPSWPAATLVSSPAGTI